jgi:hypothetical protein
MFGAYFDFEASGYLFSNLKCSGLSELGAIFVYIFGAYFVIAASGNLFSDLKFWGQLWLTTSKSSIRKKYT